MGENNLGAPLGPSENSPRNCRAIFTRAWRHSQPFRNFLCAPQPALSDRGKSNGCPLWSKALKHQRSSSQICGDWLTPFPMSRLPMSRCPDSRSVPSVVRFCFPITAITCDVARSRRFSFPNSSVLLCALCGKDFSICVSIRANLRQRVLSLADQWNPS